jgi:hypothetical protein
MQLLKSSLIAIISSIVRTLLVSGLTWLSTRNLVDQAASDQLLVIGPIAISAIVWSVIERYVIARLNLEKLNIALDLPAGSTQENLKDALQKNKADNSPAL